MKVVVLSKFSTVNNKNKYLMGDKYFIGNKYLVCKAEVLSAYFLDKYLIYNKYLIGDKSCIGNK